MVKKITLNAESRAEKNDKAHHIRKQGLIPAVLYGPKMEPITLKVKLSELEKAYKSAGESQLVNLTLDGKDDYKVIIKDVQRDSIKNKIAHADFYKVDMKRLIEVEIPLHFVGEAKAEKELGGTLIKNAETAHVKCLPSDLADFIKVDISGLNTFDDMIYFKDLNLPEGAELLNHPDDVIIHVMEPKVEEEPVIESTPAAEDGKSAAAKAGTEEENKKAK